MKKGTKLYSVFRGKCPKCHEGDMFESRNPYNLAKTMSMHNECPNCGESFNPEPGFYFGAMYVSYGLGVAQFVATWVALIVLGVDSHPAVVFAWVLFIVLALAPLSFRLSRKIWINAFVKYEANPDKKMIKKEI